MITIWINYTKNMIVMILNQRWISRRSAQMTVNAINGGYVLDGWDKTNDKNENLGYFDVSEKELYPARHREDITLKANWKPNAKYLYTPSKYTNSYNITDDNNKEISFKFYVDGKQEKEEVTEITVLEKAQSM